MLPAGCSRRLVAELWDALDACAEQQRQLEQSLQVSRRLLRTWEPDETPSPEPTPGLETNEKAPFPAYTPSPQDLKELELLTQALEKALQVRKGISKARGRDKASSLKSGSTATPAASAPPRASKTKPPRGTHQTTMPTKGLPKPGLLSAEYQTCMRRGPQAAKPGPSLRDQQIAPSAAPQAPEAFTLKEKGTLLRLPMAFRKAAFQNSRLWAQLSSTQTSDSMDAIMSSRTQFLQKMQVTSGRPSSGLSAAEVEAEVGRLQNACLLLRLRVREELTTDPMDWMQEYRCLLTLEGLQAIVGQCLYRLQQLQAVARQQLGPWPEGRLPRASLPCGRGADPIWSPQLLLYSSTQELQTLAALRLRVGMLDQQIHLEKVLMAELLPLVSMQEPLGPSWLALCRAVHSLLCEGGQRFLTVLQDEPAD
ncbi:tubulin epsilon and delta complex protein 2 [Pteronotus mesoamericanus]|uniref:tubulin epsilon and delta complex protein 2 n=1 Tax=Pteronotus mesoamericanus TaxID=1884717 RepID=UPI0023EA8D40|nr:tubulin epsilon and delta complex protein 2 [Pteronotus parnellii mesoamericanus]